MKDPLALQVPLDLLVAKESEETKGPKVMGESTVLLVPKVP